MMVEMGVSVLGGELTAIREVSEYTSLRGKVPAFGECNTTPPTKVL